MSTSEHAVRHARDRGFSWGTAFASLIAIAAGAVVGGALAYRSIFASALEEATTIDTVPLIGEDRPPAPLPPTDGAKGEPVNILLMGSDARDGGNGGIGGRAHDTTMRSDTTIIMHISADRTRVELISIPRDTRVRIADCYTFDGQVVRGWTAKFNAAFYNGSRDGRGVAEGAACTQRTVEQLTGIFIHYYAVVDFTGFIGMIDAIGGVPMCIEHDIYAPKARLNIQAGPQLLDGRTALAYARLRTAESSGGTVDGSDIQRIERQQELLANTAEYAMAQGILFKPPELREFLAAGAETMTMSPELADIDFLAGLAFSLRNVEKENIVFVTTPWRYTADGADVEWTSAAYRLFDQVVADTPISGRSVADASNIAEPEPEPSLESETPQDIPATGTDEETPETPAPELDPTDPTYLLAGCSVNR